MIEEPQLPTNDTYEVYPGCPTLTFSIKGQEIMMPYHSFKDGFFEKGFIRLRFEAGEVLIRGQCLDEFWGHFQLQDVRSVKCNETVADDTLQIDKIVWIVVKEKD